MERRKLVYEPKILLGVLLPSGEKTEVFIRGNATEADVLAKLGLLSGQYRLYHEGRPLEGKSLKELGLSHHTQLEIRGGKIYRKRCRTCGITISGLSPEELQQEVGIHIGETRHRRFSEVEEVKE